MKSSFWLVLAVALVMLSIGSMVVISVSAKPHLDLGKYLKDSLCQNADKLKGKLIIDAHQKVLNDVDLGVVGFWAFDDYGRHIKVWQLSSSEFCAIVTWDDGDFVTIAGPSPEGTGTVKAGIAGDFEGGYISIVFTATLLTHPTKPTHGDIGTVNYNCDQYGNCANLPDWPSFYFSSSTPMWGSDPWYSWWGWQYHSGHLHGTWITTITGDQGDLTS